MKQPEVSVGIVTGQEMSFNLTGQYTAKGETVSGEHKVCYKEGGINWNGTLYQELTFNPSQKDNCFSLNDVTIGIDFHWERKETQVFKGILHIIVDEGKLCAINILPVEDYLVSVISSEMSANASLEFLKAHAVISRSWLIAQMKRRKDDDKNHKDNFFSFRKTENSLIRWYDRDDHTLFDVCADDHCQRYQGITRASSPQVITAVKETLGEVLTYNGTICDARFSKCCGGVTELFSTCWEDIDLPYIKGKRDYISNPPLKLPDLTQESAARKWIESSPHSFCNTSNKRILSQILNNYDQETTDFYRWKVEYTQEEISSLINRKLKSDFGEIIDLVPVKRGPSGRLQELQIVGTLKTFTIGKELLIRRALSETHLFSSAFVVDKEYSEESEGTSPRIPSRFILHGAGWGHGVGLCQIGAAVMGERGYKYDEILLHYYDNAKIDKLY